MAQKFAFATAEAIHAMLDISHPRRALNALITKDMEVFDAPIGDASCHARPPPVTNGAAIIHAHLEKTGKTQHALEQVQAYDTLHKNDRTDGQVRRAADFENGGLGSPDSEALYTELTDLLDPNHWRMLCDFFSKTVDSTKSYTIWGTLYSRRGNPLYLYTNSEAETSKKASDRTNLDADLKVHLGQANLAYLTQKMDNVMRNTKSIEQEAVQVISNPEYRAVIDLGNGKTYQAGEVYAVFLIQLYLDYQARQPFIVSARHLSIVDDHIVWNGTVVLLFAPNDNGSWDYVAEPTQRQKNQVVTYYNMWHTSELGSVGTGLNSDSFEEFKKTVKKTNIPWRLFQYGSVHPSYAKRADRTEFPGEAELIELSKTIRDKYRFTDIDCPGISFKSQLSGEERLDLATQWACAYSAGLPIKDGHEYGNVEGLSNVRVFTNKPFSFAVNHVRSQTFAQVEAGVDENWNKYVAAGCPKLGRFLVRYGSGAVYCPTRDEAATFDKLKHAAQKRYIRDSSFATFF